MAETLRAMIGWLIYQCRLLRYRPRLIWNRLWIRKDEFHKSLTIDSELLLRLNTKDARRYRKDLAERRWIAHNRDIDEQDRLFAERARKENQTDAPT